MVAPEIRPATLADVDQIAEIMADGFYDDPPMTWCFNGPAAIYPVMQVFARRTYLPHGFASISEAGNGATMWLPPNATTPFDLISMARVSMILLRYGGFKSISRSLKFADYMESHHPHEPHYYLFTIATTQAARGKGVGGALMKDGTDRADAEGIGCYLENSKEQNIGFYQAHGFEIMEKVFPVKGGPPMWRMWRAPK